mmetsp:Transcript_67244/g.196597  ORF Transcript_67244/g.196597 Transcript_67244/m.196597 type:complete len:214 (-) Transcript_67244:576-1217(-)
MPQSLSAREPSGLVHHQEPADEVLRLPRRVQPCLPCPVVVPRLDPAHGLPPRLVAGDAEGAGAHEEHVEAGAQGPGVGQDRRPPPLIDFGGCVGQGADALHGPRLLGAEDDCGAKVAELDDVSVGRARLAQKQEVLCLDISVHDVAGVEVANGIEHLPEEHPPHLLAQAPALAGAHLLRDALVELAAPAELEDYPKVALVLEALVHPYQVRML